MTKKIFVDEFSALIKKGVSKFENIIIEGNVDFSDMTLDVFELISIEFEGDMVFRNTTIDRLILFSNRLNGKVITNGRRGLTSKNLSVITKFYAYSSFGIELNYCGSAIEDFFDKTKKNVD